jgi:hypothetical protein
MATICSSRESPPINVSSVICPLHLHSSSALLARQLLGPIFA